MLLPGIGEAGQQRLAQSHALLVGCGALGSVIAELLVRAGIGTLTLVDRDVVELTNLQRQVLFNECDASDGVPKAIAAQRRLKAINHHVDVIATVDDFNASNAERFIAGADVILDGLDNYETRYLLNDLAVKHDIPYIHGGAVGTTGTAMSVLPRRSACLRCVFPEIPPTGSTATCDTAGVLGPVVNMIASHQTTEAIKFLTGNEQAMDQSLLSIDLWHNRIHRTNLAHARDDSCECCGRRTFVFLDAAATSTAVTLCGRNAVQINPAGSSRPAQLDLAAVAERLADHGHFTSAPHLLRGTFSSQRESGAAIELTLFPNGRAIIKGTDQVELARSMYARYLGS